MRAATIAALVLSGAALGRASAREVRCLAGLREGRLFETAEKWAAERQSLASLSATDRVDLIVELIRTYAVHAVNAPPSERDEIWKQAQEVGDQFLKRESKHPR